MNSTHPDFVGSLEKADLELQRRHGAGEVGFGHRGMGHGGIDHAGEEAALADAALRMAEGRHDLEAKAAESALGIEFEDLADQDLDRLVEMGVEDFSASASLSPAMSVPAKSG